MTILQGWKMQDRNTEDHFAEPENAKQQNAKNSTRIHYTALCFIWSS